MHCFLLQKKKRQQLLPYICNLGEERGGGDEMHAASDRPFGFMNGNRWEAIEIKYIFLHHQRNTRRSSEACFRLTRVLHASQPGCAPFARWVAICKEVRRQGNDRKKFGFMYYCASGKDNRQNCQTLAEASWPWAMSLKAAILRIAHLPSFLPCFKESCLLSGGHAPWQSKPVDVYSEAIPTGSMVLLDCTAIFLPFDNPEGSTENRMS